MRYAIVNKETSVVENVIELDEPELWTTPSGYLVIQTDTADINSTYKDGVFSGVTI